MTQYLTLEELERNRLGVISGFGYDPFGKEAGILESMITEEQIVECIAGAITHARSVTEGYPHYTKEMRIGQFTNSLRKRLNSLNAHEHNNHVAKSLMDTSNWQEIGVPSYLAPIYFHQYMRGVTAYTANSSVTIEMQLNGMQEILRSARVEVESIRAINTASTPVVNSLMELLGDNGQQE